MSNDPRVARILGEWQRARDAGSAPEPAVVITEHPELAEQLRAGFAMITALDEVYAHERGAAQTFPSRIGPYALVREIGTGGMGTVYEATVAQQVSGLEIGDRVALKVVHPHLLARAGFFKRFLREAEAGRRVRHSKVVSTLDADARETDGRTHLYLVMEYVEGRTLRELLEDLGVVPEALVREIAAQLADGLAGIHETGVVHRDLKPDNVIIMPDDQIRIMDMGVARLDDDHGTLTEHGQFAGSLHYAAPEQFDAREVGPATDLYALGVLLYELATGDNPFRRDDVGSTIRAHLEEVPPRADDRETTVSRYVAEVLHTLLAKDPGSRFASASELAEVLNEAERSPWWAAREQAALKAHAHFPRVPVRRETVLHGREDELALLAAAWDSAKQGEGRSVLFEGEAGIGKSRLIDAFLQDLPDEDVHVLYGSYSPGGGEGAITDAIREHFGTAELADALRPYLVESSALVEPLAALLRHERAPSGSPLLGGNALQTALSRLMQGLAAEKPLIWIVEDLHFASLESRNVVLSLARALQSRCVLLIMTTRPGLPEELRAHFGRIESYRRTALSRLGARDVILLLEAAFHSKRLAEKLGARIAKASDGVPFFVFEMIRGLREGQLVTQLPDGSWGATSEIDRIEVPPTVRDLIEARLRGLDDEDRALLDLMAVEGYIFSPALAAQALGLPLLRVLQRLAAIERRSGIVRSQDDRARFDHHVLREFLYGAIPAALLREYHGLLADALEVRSGGEAVAPEALAGGTCAELCAHFLRSGRGSRATRYLSTALVRLNAECGSERAIELADLALDAPALIHGEDRVDVILAKNLGLSVLGRRDEVRDALAEARALAEKTKNRTTALKVELALGCSAVLESRYAEAETHLVRAIQSAREVGDKAIECRASQEFGVALTDVDRHEEAQAWYERALMLAEEVGDQREAAMARMRLGSAACERGQHEEALAMEGEALRAFVELGDRNLQGYALLGLASTLTTLGRTDEARDRFREAETVAHETGSLQLACFGHGNLGSLDHNTGRLEEARRHFEAAVRLSQQIKNRATEAHYLVVCGQTLLQLGRLQEAKEALERALSLAHEIGSRSYEGFALANLAEVAKEQDEIEIALELIGRARLAYEEVLPEALGGFFGLLHSSSLMQLGSCRLLAGDTRGARDALRDAVRLLRRQGNPVDLATATALLASLSGGQIEIEEAEEDLRDAGERAFVPTAPYYLWRASGKPEHLVDAKRRLDALLEHVGAESRDSMCRNLRLNRAILAAWRSEFGEDGAPGDAPTG